MGLRVSDVMQTDVHTVRSDSPVTELERLLIEHRVSGLPVVDGDRLVGVVSRSDVVRSLVVERTWAEQLSDYYRGLPGGVEENPEESLQDLGERIGARIEQMTVADVMVKAVLSASPDQSIAELAEQMLSHHIHRLPVVNAQNALIGVVTSFDLVRLIAERRIPSE
jgi:CBS domain-containing protein